MTPREAAFKALSSHQFASEALGDWQRRSSPDPRDFRLAQEIAYGTTRMARALDAAAKQLTPTGKLQLKRKEKALLRTALYQALYMERIPLYAIAEESVALAKKEGMHHFARFLNALLRRLEKAKPDLKNEPLAIRLSFPDIFVEKLEKAYGAKTEEILKALNMTPKLFARRMDASFEMVPVENVQEAAKDKGLYIQNSTPVALIRALAELSPKPQAIADLCASPGGKSLAAKTLYPEAMLVANDVTDEKTSRLQENFAKYGIDARIAIGPAEEFPLTEPFDLVIADVPCSNTGVLHKKPEARWRLDEEQLEQLKALQEKILERSLRLGKIVWYLTCSILPEENEELVLKVAASFGKKVHWSKVILPDASGSDGGFAALIY